VIERTDTDDTDALAGSGTVVLERGVARHTRAKHGSGVGALETVGDSDSETALASD
jgi:hypothetical protein